jgi:L-ascorbate metabolism protein UlaG (beta-lactamase superfamily)
MGQEATSKFSLEKGLSIFRMTHDGDGHFGVVLLDAEGDHIDLLANEIGEFDGSKAVGISKAEIYLLDISADGSWTITIEQPRPSQAPPVPKTLKGTGQQAAGMFYLDTGLVVFEMTHDGDGHFGVVLLDAEGDPIDLLANEIGEFDGSKAVGINKAGIYLLDISADGNWEISIE